MTLQKRDQYLLELFIENLDTNIPISFNKDGNPTLYVTCKIMAAALLNKGFNHQKSYSADINKITSHVPDRLINHMIRGMVDGDGCVGIYHYDYLKKPQFHFGYTGLLNVCEYIGKILNINNKIRKESEHAYTIKTRNVDIIIDIFNYLYRDATIYMNRKYEKFKEIELITFNDYNNGIQTTG